jgi:toxin CcdB
LAQFDVHRNPRRSTAGDIPFVVDVQSDALADATRRVVIPLARGDRIRARSETLNPEFEVDGVVCVAMPLDMASIPTSALGEVTANLADHGDRIVRSIDELVARY